MASAEALVATVMVDIAVVLLCGAVLGRLMARLGQPSVIGEILSGIALGPSLLGLLPGNISERLFPPAAVSQLNTIAQFAVLLFMFLVGWELDAALLKSNRVAIIPVCVISIALCASLGAGLGWLLHSSHATVNGSTVPRQAFVLFMAAAMSFTALPVLARILREHQLGPTPLGTLALACAGLCDVLSWGALAAVVLMVHGTGPFTLARNAVLLAGYLLVLWLVVRPLLRYALNRWGSSHMPAMAAVMCAGLLASSVVTMNLGLHGIFGAFVFGLVVPRDIAGTFAKDLRHQLFAAVSLLLPVFFVVTGLGVDLSALTTQDYPQLALVIAVACTGKYLGTIVGAKPAGLSWRDASALGVLMNTRGLTELVVLNVGLTLGLLDRRIFTMMVLMALITTAMTSPLLRLGGMIPKREETYAALRSRWRTASGTGGSGSS